MKTKENTIYDVIIIGAGIAGLSAALYTARQRMSTLVISKDLGGQLTLTELIENYPGIEAISGLGLAQKLEKQAKRFGAEFIYGEEVKKIEEYDGIFVINGIRNKYLAKTVILAFGKTPRELGVPGEQEFKGKGVSYCAICDAAFFRDKSVAVVGEGEPGLEAVELVARYASKVYYVTSSEQIVGNEELIEKISSNPNVKIIKPAKVIQIFGNRNVEGIVLRFLNTHEVMSINVDGVIIELGYILKTDFLKGFVELNEKGEVIVDELGRTSRQGIFAAGDITNTPYKQAVIAAAEGVKAALSAYNYLRAKSGLPPVKVDWKAEKVKKVSLRL